MKQIQKRYIYAGFLSAVFFIIVYGILDFDVWISVLLTAIVYFGGIFLYKEKDMRELNAKNIDNYYFLASKCANKARLCENEQITKAVDKIATYTDEIIVSLSQRPKKVEQVFDFFDYYLDITNKILTRYLLAKKHNNKTQKDADFVDNTVSYLTTITDCFKKQLDNMKEARMLDIESEIRIFEHTIGFKKTDIEVGEDNEFK